MRPSPKTILRCILATSGIVLAAGLAAPFIRASQYGEQIRAGIERALQRRVEILGEVRFNLFTGPGFTIGEVVIHDDPAAGIEPFAHTLSLEARVSLLSLLGGRLEFSTLRFDEPRVNLVKPDHSTWNILPLLQRSGGSKMAGQPGRIPVIEISAGRVNFKFGDTKSEFYLANADITIAPRSDGAVDFRFTGEPARTDRISQSFGALRGRGRWLPGSGGREPRLEMDFDLDKTAIDEVAQLVGGNVAGVHGLVVSRARISGPVSNLQVSGRLDVEDIHRWTAAPSRSGVLTMNYKGTLDWGRQTIELVAPAADNPGLGVSWHARLFDFMAQPRWAVNVTLDQLPATSLIDLARDMGTPVPQQLSLSGKVVGVIGYSSTSGVQGRISVREGILQFSGTSKLRIPQAELSLSGDEIALTPVQFAGETGQAATVDGFYDAGENVFSARISGRSLPIADLQNGAGHLLSSASVPFVKQLRGGTWTGALMYHQDGEAPAAWIGDMQIQNTRSAIPGIATPIQVLTASVLLEGDRLVMNRVRGRAGDIDFEGDYRYEPSEERPHRFRLVSPLATLEELEQLFLPTLQRERGFLARTLRLREPGVPEWLQSRQAEGTVRFQTLIAGENELRRVRANVVWQGAEVRLSGISAGLEEASLEGSGVFSLQLARPRYRLQGKVRNLAFKEGRVDVDGSLQTQGIALDLLLNLRSRGVFEARSLTVLPDYPFSLASGSYEFSMTSTGPQITLTALEAAVGTEQFSGQGATQSDGKLQLDLVSSSRTMRLSGPLMPLRLEVSTEPAPAVPLSR